MEEREVVSVQEAAGRVLRMRPDVLEGPLAPVSQQDMYELSE